MPIPRFSLQEPFQAATTAVVVLALFTCVAWQPASAYTSSGSSDEAGGPSSIHGQQPSRTVRITGAAPSGYTPSQVRAAYGFNQIPNQGQGQTIAIVDPTDDPTVESDLQSFDNYFHLPACTTQNGCFRKVYANGNQPPPGTEDRQVEIALDVEWAHAIAPSASIVLVEAQTNADGSLNLADLLLGVDVAVAQGASIVSMSWGVTEFVSEGTYDYHFEVPGVTFCAADGDSGHEALYPAASPYVVGVGGTILVLLTAAPPANPLQSDYGSETAWPRTGGGTSSYESEPAYQSSVQGTGFRGIPDLAYDAFNTPVYISYDGLQWVTQVGTSIGSPQTAALFAIANSMRFAAGKETLTQALPDLYSFTYADFHDITTGSNGNCGSQCQAGPGYDFVTGIGTPKANALSSDLVRLGGEAIYSPLHSFASFDGASPQGGLVQASDGNFYGTTETGGEYNNGTVFRYNVSTQQVTVLHSFNGTDGNQPLANLIQATDGNLYGVTKFAGNGGDGTVFRIDLAGQNFAIVHSFSGRTDGAEPFGGVIQGADGNLYGTTYLGGQNGGGTAFKMDLNGNIITHHDFPISQNDGAQPTASFVQGKDGNFYNTTLAGGASNAGTIFVMDSNATVTVLHSISPADGISTLLQSPLLQGMDGSLYGEAQGGGAYTFGAVFKIDTTGENFLVLHSFSGPDGTNPSGGLIQVSSGTFYGTTIGAGAGPGETFQMDISGNVVPLDVFRGDPDGSQPLAGVIQGSDGSLYGTASMGGTSNDGIIFKITFQFD